MPAHASGRSRVPRAVLVAAVLAVLLAACPPPLGQDFWTTGGERGLRLPLPQPNVRCSQPSALVGIVASSVDPVGGLRAALQANGTEAQPLRHAVFDASNTRVGDVLFGAPERVELDGRRRTPPYPVLAPDPSFTLLDYFRGLRALSLPSSRARTVLFLVTNVSPSTSSQAAYWQDLYDASSQDPSSDSWAPTPGTTMRLTVLAYDFESVSGVQGWSYQPSRSQIARAQFATDYQLGSCQ